MGSRPLTWTLGDARRASYWTLVLATSSARERRVGAGEFPTGEARRRLPEIDRVPLAGSPERRLTLAPPTVNERCAALRCDQRWPGAARRTHPRPPPRSS